ncbi:MAG: site-specific integrase [Gemmatimonadetes bacterium]|nr:site-specific integrase [Gemmatimonadota bacterium]
MAKAPGTIRRRGSGWNVIIRHNGKRHEFGPRGVEFLGTAKTRKEVEEWTFRKHAELVEDAENAAKREALGTPEAKTFSELLDRFRSEVVPTLAEGTQAAYEDTFKPAREFFFDQLGDPLLEDIRSRHISDFLSWRRVNRRDGEAPLSNRTLEKDRAVLHRIFDQADEWEWREGNPVSRVKRPKYDKHNWVIIDSDQYEKLLAECSAYGPMLGLYALVLGEAGLRAYTEALWLRWEDVDLEEGFLHIRSGRDRHRTKSGESRWVPMTRRLVAAVREHMASYRLRAYRGERSPWVFHHVGDKEGVYRAGDRIRDLRSSFDAAVDRAKLPDGFRRHDLRHRRVTVWIADGKSPALVQEAMGHSDLRTTMGYTHLSKKHLRSLVEESAAVPPSSEVARA